MNAVATLLERSAQRVVEVCLQDNLGAKRLGRIGPFLEQTAVTVTLVPVSKLDELAGTHRHQGVVARIKGSAVLGEHEASDLLEQLENPLVLVLDGIEDPHNFGACLRSANAAGADLVVTARSRNVGLTPTVSKVASGAAEVQPLAQVANLARYMGTLRDLGVWLVGTDGGASQTIYNTDLRGPIGLVLGSEGRGIRRLTRESCDAIVSLPLLGTVESLNVSVATGICLYEAVRQRTT
ncbi:MAG: 23S rRNA (guanosine(2251)-2'-O)-methyltransferase RlmB [Gammaproteobacteria bacterium]|nr:23S rRNA (guanosine(2251)-2'-O)-methyltransferase RlmB [Gammaproteobacteria bacterium]